MTKTKIKLLGYGGILTTIFLLIFFYEEGIFGAGQPSGPMIRLMICLDLPQTSYFLYQPSANAICGQNDVIWSISNNHFDSCIGKKIQIEVYQENREYIWSKEIVISNSSPLNPAKYTFKILKFSPHKKMYYPQSSPWRNHLWSDIEILRLKFIDHLSTDKTSNSIYFTPSCKYLIKTTTGCANISLSTQSYGKRKEIIADMQSWAFFGKNPLFDYTKN